MFDVQENRKQESQEKTSSDRGNLGKCKLPAISVFMSVASKKISPFNLKSLSDLVQYRGHPCLGLAAIFAGILYNVQIIQKSSTRNSMHVSIIVLELPAKLQWVID